MRLIAKKLLSGNKAEVLSELDRVLKILTNTAETNKERHALIEQEIIPLIIQNLLCSKFESVVEKTFEILRALNDFSFDKSVDLNKFYLTSVEKMFVNLNILSDCSGRYPGSLTSEELRLIFFGFCHFWLKLPSFTWDSFSQPEAECLFPNTLRLLISGLNERDSKIKIRACQLVDALFLQPQIYSVKRLMLSVEPELSLKLVEFLMKTCKSPKSLVRQSGIQGFGSLLQFCIKNKISESSWRVDILDNAFNTSNLQQSDILESFITISWMLAFDRIMRVKQTLVSVLQILIHACDQEYSNTLSSFKVNILYILMTCTVVSETTSPSQFDVLKTVHAFEFLLMTLLQRYARSSTYKYKIHALNGITKLLSFQEYPVSYSAELSLFTQLETHALSTSAKDTVDEQVLFDVLKALGQKYDTKLLIDCVIKFSSTTEDNVAKENCVVRCSCLKILIGIFSGISSTNCSSSSLEFVFHHIFNIFPKCNFFVYKYALLKLISRLIIHANFTITRKVSFFVSVLDLGVMTRNQELAKKHNSLENWTEEENNMFFLNLVDALVHSMHTLETPKISLFESLYFEKYCYVLNEEFLVYCELVLEHKSLVRNKTYEKLMASLLKMSTKTSTTNRAIYLQSIFTLGLFLERHDILEFVSDGVIFESYEYLLENFVWDIGLVSRVIRKVISIGLVSLFHYFVENESQLFLKELKVEALKTCLVSNFDDQSTVTRLNCSRISEALLFSLVQKKIFFERRTLCEKECFFKNLFNLCNDSDKLVRISAIRAATISLYFHCGICNGNTMHLSPNSEPDWNNFEIEEFETIVTKEQEEFVDQILAIFLIYVDDNFIETRKTAIFGLLHLFCLNLCRAKLIMSTLKTYEYLQHEDARVLIDKLS